ncbi:MULTISPECIES: ABC transporter ATP-binding protein [Brevibacillus]|jgi:putative ABC transport system ATP-binding protein|uniref:Macrolide ABC transporter ATP-binding protein n=1 Tax=Brevibacillus parabrevis TaxID=54914 RepID=A0A4Y3PLD4_BREPA|nr:MULTISPECIES: ABC transporter ATP-binding protein [Brevibacillus]MBU8715091.1 ABC transporter ATP-binding protein [Brevibacillus parabrevis]MDR4999974.1 ABC transporter ATP-binding protein [Brevibacillus parabrevis]MED2255145.1 ABC transporter ATP-binding protein [Brevibacillus parabrevis]NRQ54900.1 ABC transporter ATP-binding protein [Brevibacillus sp. HD1.4A]RNB93015.1 ABC transporter ATP-binding protein [Brevibacillus parabrevis]
MLQVEGLTKSYKTGDSTLPILKGVSLLVEQGEFVAIMGPSGSGKSTFMNMLGCLDRPDTGSYILDGIEVSSLNDKQLAYVRNQKIGFVFQSFNLLARSTSLHNVELPMMYANVSRSERRNRATEALKRVGLGERMHHKPTQLSGGQKQRVAIARALVNRPAILLADEPTGNLDSRSGVEIMSIFQELHAQGVTIILVTHEMDIAQHAERIVTFKDGIIIRDERVEERVFSTPNDEVIVT